MNMESVNSKLLGATVALIIAILSGLGVGSGGLFVIWLTLIEGMGANDARGLNLLFFVFSAGAALVFHLLRRRLNLRLILFLSLFAAAGTIVGTYIGGIVNSLFVRRIFGGMLILSGCYTLFSKVHECGTARERSKKTKFLRNN